MLIAMNKIPTKVKVIFFLLLLAAVFVAVTSRVASDTFKELKAAESFSELDYYSMQEYCDKNASTVMSALKSGKADKIKAIMTNSEGLDEVMNFADWSQADFKNAVGLGAGSLSPGPDADGRIDMSERFFVDAGDTKYVFFIESVSSRWGRTDEGISAIAVTRYTHFDADLDYVWNGEPDDQSALAGSLFWIGNQPKEAE